MQGSSNISGSLGLGPVKILIIFECPLPLPHHLLSLSVKNVLSICLLHTLVSHSLGTKLALLVSHAMIMESQVRKKLSTCGKLTDNSQQVFGSEYTLVGMEMAVILDSSNNFLIKINVISFVMGVKNNQYKVGWRNPSASAMKKLILEDSCSVHGYKLFRMCTDVFSPQVGTFQPHQFCHTAFYFDMCQGLSRSIQTWGERTQNEFQFQKLSN